MSYKQMTGNIISATKVEPVGTSEVGAASGVWNLNDVYDYKRGANWPEAGVPDPDTFIESNFSTFLYEGNGSTQTITTGIDSANKSSLVWIKNRDATDSHVLTDTVRGATKILHSDTTAAEATDADTITSFTSTGFVLGDDVKVNTNAESYAAWTFKKATKFFDVVTYEGTGSARTVAHSLGGTVGMIIIKNLDQTDNWAVYHRANTAAPQTDYLILNTTAATADDAAWWNDTAPTSSVFTVGTDHAVNADGENYVAYLFAHETGDDSMIQCGGVTISGATTVNLGWEPQWVLYKKTNGTSNWAILDSMRGWTADGVIAQINPNLNNAEASGSGYEKLTSTGFVMQNYTNGNTFIYMAIRRPDMATITDATEVFAIDGSVGATAATGFPADMMLQKDIDNSGSYDDFALTDRLRNTMWLETSSTSAETNGSIFGGWDSNTTAGNGGSNASLWGEHAWAWKRAKGFFDIVAYTGTGSALNVTHSLAVAPEMMWIKNRGVADPWAVYYGDNTDYLILDTTAATADNAAWWNDTSPTSSVFTVNTDHSVNASGEKYIAYLFATLAGVSKLGTVTHSGTSTDVACGFSAGARFVMLKRSDATGDWYIWDSVRGIIAGDDPYVLLNSTAATVTNTDLIDPLASGFQISGDFTDGDYIFYAIA